MSRFSAGNRSRISLLCACVLPGRGVSIFPRRSYLMAARRQEGSIMSVLSFFARLLMRRWAVPIITAVPLMVELWARWGL